MLPDPDGRPSPQVWRSSRRSGGHRKNRNHQRSGKGSRHPDGGFQLLRPAGFYGNGQVSQRLGQVSLGTSPFDSNGKPAWPYFKRQTAGYVLVTGVARVMFCAEVRPHSNSWSLFERAQTGRSAKGRATSPSAPLQANAVALFIPRGCGRLASRHGGSTSAP